MRILFLAIALLVSFSGFTQNFSITLEPVTMTDLPGVHSFCIGQDDVGRWLIVGGRVDGLHQRQPFAAFLEEDNNKMIYVVDIENEVAIGSSLSVLDEPLFEQLQATNAQFFQREGTLYITGGYGFSASANDHITFPYLTAIDVNGAIEAIVNGESVTPFFRQVYNADMAVTGGQMGHLDGVFYLMAGQYFEGRYNPMGTDFGPGFVQEYSEEIRRFGIEDDGVTMSITNYSADNDPANLHRRDYNASPQIFPDGTQGFTIFSGVFQPTEDIPWLNSVDVYEDGHVVNNDFQQFLSQYHSATLPIYSAVSNEMSTVFFGGISRYYYDISNNLIDDINTPFVTTISKVTRFGDGTMEEHKIGDMPALLGAGAEFLPVDIDAFDDQGILLHDALSESTVVGYIIGGIESSADNIFFVNDGSQSQAHETVYRVVIELASDHVETYAVKDGNLLQLEVHPNPADLQVLLTFFNPAPTNSIDVQIVDMQGKVVKRLELEAFKIGYLEFSIDTSQYAAGSYIIRMENGIHTDEVVLLKP
jgi:hypothetical protein